LSGGGNLGALEAGALLALLEHGIMPDMLVGCSVGAINAAALAVNPTIEGAQHVAQLWRQVEARDIFRGNYLSMIFRVLMHRNSLFCKKHLKRFVESHMPLHIRYFGDIRAVQLYIVAANLNTGRLEVFGDDPSDSLVDAVMASCAAIPHFPPWNYRGQQYVDGGALSVLPVGVAVEKGALEIYAIDVNCLEEIEQPIKGWLNISRRVARMVAQRQFENDLRWARCCYHANIHHIPIEYPQRLHMWELEHGAEMVEIGRQVAENFLNKQATVPDQPKGSISPLIGEVGE